MADEPEYNVYRSRKGALSRFKRDEPGGIAELRKQRQRQPQPPQRTRRPFSWGRVLKWITVAIASWILFSIAVFFVSAELAERSSGSAQAALSPGGSLMTGSTILVLGSDARPADSKEPGAGGPARSDSMMLLRVAFGSVRRVSILRDSQADIPGHGVQKINAAYALGGAGLAVRTVEEFMGNGLEINHVLEVSFADFPKLIDALGGIDVTLKRCIRSNRFGDRVFRLRKGTHRLNGRQALAFSRIRQNACTPGEDDRARAKRQQQVMSSMRSALFSPRAFVRLPLVAWAAPRTIRSDMHSPGLAMLFTDLVTGYGGRTRVLTPSGSNGTQLLISDEAKRSAVRALLR